MPQSLLDVRPEFVKQVRPGIRGNAQRAVDERVARGVRAFRHPGVLDKARAVRTAETPHCEGFATAVGPADEDLSEGVGCTVLDASSRGLVVARIFAKGGIESEPQNVANRRIAGIGRDPASVARGALTPLVGVVPQLLEA